MLRIIFMTALLLEMWIGAQAQNKAKVTLKVDLKNVDNVVIEPFTNFPIYTYATAKIVNGEAVLEVETDKPLMAALRVKRLLSPVHNLSLYLEPGKEIAVIVTKKDSDLNPTTDYKGELAEECAILRDFRSQVMLLNINNVDNEKLLNDVRAALDKAEGCSPEFKKLFFQSVEFKIREKELSNQRVADLKAYKKELRSLLAELKHNAVWQSIPLWPYVLDHIFMACEEEGLVEKEDGFENRLACIGDEDTKNRYGIYCLNRLVNCRDWYENPPLDIIGRLRPCMTTKEAKKDFEEVVENFERIQEDWAHFRNQEAPDFTFEDVNGKMVTLSDYKGKFVLLDVWNIYCGPCMNQVPYLQKYEPELEKMGVVVIGVSCDPQNIKDKWRATVKQKQMTGIQVIMDKGRQSRFMTDYAIIGFPTFCLINPDGMVVNPYMSRPETADFMEYIKTKIEEYNANKN